MTDAAASTSHPASDPLTGSLIIPDEWKNKDPELVDLIAHSESMNDEERQYWINTLTVMTPAQVENLRQILKREREQLAAIDAKYAKEMQTVDQRDFLAAMEEEHKKRSARRTQREEDAAKESTQRADSILEQIEQI